MVLGVPILKHFRVHITMKNQKKMLPMMTRFKRYSNYVKINFFLYAHLHFLHNKYTESEKDQLQLWRSWVYTNCIHVP